MANPPTEKTAPKGASDNQEHDPSGIRLGAWDAGLFGCFAYCVPNCCMAWLFPCVSVAQISSRIGLFKYSHIFLIFFLLYLATISLTSVSAYYLLRGAKGTIKGVLMDDSDPTAVDAQLDKAGNKLDNSVKLATIAEVCSSISATLYFVLIWHLREKVRGRFQIPGNCFFDFITSAFCSCCAIAQMATHVKSYKPGSCDFGPPDTLPAYQ